jgi:hypothetical protein
MVEGWLREKKPVQHIGSYQDPIRIKQRLLIVVPKDGFE